MEMLSIGARHIQVWADAIERVHAWYYRRFCSPYDRFIIEQKKVRQLVESLKDDADKRSEEIRKAQGYWEFAGFRDITKDEFDLLSLNHYIDWVSVPDDNYTRPFFLGSRIRVIGNDFGLPD